MKYWGYELKLVQFIDRRDRKQTVTAKVYQAASQIKGLVKYYLGVVHHWTVTRLNMLVAEIGLDDFIRRAGKLEFGTEGFEYAVALVEEMK